MKKYIIAGAAFLFPFVSFAVVPTPTYTNSLLGQINGWINTLTPLVIGASMLFFLYGLMKFVLAAGNEDAKEEGKRIMIWGIITLFVMISVWGLVGLVNQETGIAAGGAAAGTPTAPAYVAP